MTIRKPDPTPEEAVARILKQREKQREYKRKPEAREKQRKYQRKLAAGYAAAKKAGLI